MAEPTTTLKLDTQQFITDLNAVYAINQTILAKAKQIYAPFVENVKKIDISQLKLEELQKLEIEISDMHARMQNGYKRMQEYRKPKTEGLEMIMRSFSDLENQLATDSGYVVLLSNAFQREILKRKAGANQDATKTDLERAEQNSIYAGAIQHLNNKVIDLTKDRRTKINDQYVVVTQVKDVQERRTAALELLTKMATYKPVLDEGNLHLLKNGYAFTVKSNNQDIIPVLLHKALGDSTDTLTTAYNNQMTREKERVIFLLRKIIEDPGGNVVLVETDHAVDNNMQPSETKPEIVETKPQGDETKEVIPETIPPVSETGHGPIAEVPGDKNEVKGSVEIFIDEKTIAASVPTILPEEKKTEEKLSAADSKQLLLLGAPTDISVGEPLSAFATPRQQPKEPAAPKRVYKKKTNSSNAKGTNKNKNKR